jgi:rhamnulokinase
MPDQIARWRRAHGAPAPDGVGETARGILESLALRYRQVLENLEALLGRRLARIHIVGGGSQNELLNQLVADATGRAVVAGPTEATAAGNILVQAIGAGALGSLEEARILVARSFPLTTYEPHPKADWDSAYARFCAFRP